MGADKRGMKTLIVTMLLVSAVKTNAQTEPAPAPSPNKAPLATESGGRWQFALGLGYMLSTQDGKFSDARAGATTGEAEFDYEKTYSLIAEARYLPANDWGVLLGLNYEGQRQFDGGTIKGGGVVVTLTGGSDASKVQFSTLYASAAYRWNEFYLPFGLNYSVVKFTPASTGGNQAYDASGELGAQLGVGWFFEEHFAIELHSWVTGMNLRTGSGAAEIDFGSGIFPHLFLMGKYAF